MVACGNVNGIISIYDVRSNKKPFMMSQVQAEPGELTIILNEFKFNSKLNYFVFSFLVTELCFHPFSNENLLSSSYDGSLWFWNIKTNSSTNNQRFNDINERTVNAKNYLPMNRSILNSFDINMDHIVAVNNNFGMFTVKIQNLF
jgi:WD40 repeat protein